MRPHTVFFDFGGTLAEQLARPLDIWVEVAKALSLNRSPHEIGRALNDTNDWFDTAVFQYHGRTHEMWSEYDRRVLRGLGIADSDERLVASIQHHFDRVRWNQAYPESREVLETLRRRGYGLAVISNATEEVVDRLREVELAGYFQSITYSQEAGANKPDPRVFRLAMKRAGCRPDEAVHIGNTYEEDVVGARALGIAPILVDREDARPEADCPRVRDLRGVLEMFP